jgi:predicted component of type VI protein secretion system
MARLVLSLDGQVLAEYNMTKERYTVGRLPDNDIRIDNPAVSGHHALVINILNDSFLEDLNSTNGTYVNGKIVKKHAMQHGDVITVGHHSLRFIDSDDDDIKLTISTFGANLQTLARQLVLLGNDNGGRDNISVVLVKVLDAFPARYGMIDRILGMFG